MTNRYCYIEKLPSSFLTYLQQPLPFPHNTGIIFLNGLQQGGNFDAPIFTSSILSENYEWRGVVRNKKRIILHKVRVKNKKRGNISKLSFFFFPLPKMENPNLSKRYQITSRKETGTGFEGEGHYGNDSSRNKILFIMARLPWTRIEYLILIYIFSHFSRFFFVERG